jgi:hypothetical protein
VPVERTTSITQAAADESCGLDATCTHGNAPDRREEGLQDRPSKYEEPHRPKFVPGIAPRSLAGYKNYANPFDLTRKNLVGRVGFEPTIGRL